MKFLKFLLFLNSLPLGLASQSLWLEPIVKENTIYLYDHVSDSQIDSLPFNALALINYNPAIKPNKLITLNLAQSAKHQCNIFTTYQSQIFQDESLVWSARNQQSDKILLTDQRMVDLENVKFMNFINHDLSKPQINAYHHLKHGLEIDQISIGTTPNNQALPVYNFKGAIAELIFFNRVLAPQARQVLETSLAIKYSIDLSTVNNYIDINGNVLWKIDASTSFRHNIGGLGKSTPLHLNQKQSKTSLDQGFIAIGIGGIFERNELNKTELAENSYLLWADNDELIDFEKIGEGVEMIKRKWLLKNFNFATRNFTMEFSHKALEENLEADQSFWLVLNESEEISQDLEDLQVNQFVKLEDRFEITGIELPQSKESYFGLIKAPQFWGLIHQNAPSCDLNEEGKVQIKAVGGVLPYSIKIYNEDQTLIEEAQQLGNQPWRSSSLIAGKYNYILEDAYGNKFSDKFILNYEEFASPGFQENYVLSEDHEIVLDASTHLPEGLKYEWSTPNGSIVNGSMIVLDEAGLYELIISKDGCENNYEIAVKSKLNNIEHMLLSPNPTGDGLFNMEATLKTASPYQIEIYHSTGVLISSETFDTEKFINYYQKIEKAGTYLVKLQTGTSFLTKKLIVLESH